MKNKFKLYWFIPILGFFWIEKQAEWSYNNNREIIFLFFWVYHSLSIITIMNYVISK